MFSLVSSIQPPMVLHFLLVLLGLYLLIKTVTVLLEFSWRLTSSNNEVLPPSSGGFPLIGETLAFLAANNSREGLYDFVKTRRLRYGNCFRTRIFGETHVFVSSTGSAKAVMASDSVGFEKRYMRSIAELLGEQSLLCMSGELHDVLRHRLSGLFTAESLGSTIKHFDALVVEALKEWKEREAVFVLEEAMKITFNAICKMLISKERVEELEKMRKDVAEVTEAMLAFPLKLPWTRFYRGLKARKRVMDTLRNIIKFRRQRLDHPKDFLQSLLMKGESPFDAPLTDAKIQDNILTLIIAGQITTASAIAWMVKYLDENQEIQETVRAVNFPLKSKDPDTLLGLDVLSEMTFASKIVKETLRMASIVSWFPRVALRDCYIEGYRIMKGWIVNVDARSIHWDPTVHDEPTKFHPLRFNEDSTKPYSFLAFGTGGRTCLGMNLAKAMLTVFLHRLVTTYRWELIDKDSSLEKGALFPRLRSGCPIHVTPT
ncbi:Cytochrome P450 90D2 [Acorus calamus]|uniref:Cytochrome P450 90D2 n=1 Tax=Acorus calamus TaxID=4465 RepID=A0AAV9DCQ7_ACOCL|nr:Cytochrome P450 90D2 [Acorus calamus]